MTLRRKRSTHAELILRAEPYIYRALGKRSLFIEALRRKTPGSSLPVVVPADIDLFAGRDLTVAHAQMLADGKIPSVNRLRDFLARGELRYLELLESGIPVITNTTPSIPYDHRALRESLRLGLKLAVPGNVPRGLNQNEFMAVANGYGSSIESVVPGGAIPRPFLLLESQRSDRGYMMRVIAEARREA